ncbi:glutamine--fructose-6-phosphate transaminase (isomerizing) [Dasania sp. GY-MA-18]|uniref:Glutamine--fructose-6-phosphate aminotransferase [isomerizing] n=1 Tax=Dasania phycosphaerae TaxID=2950436 RepID=A0A9J6RJH5_9GAMM|nr:MULTISPECIES: glutamine--fructose-6-phosphate transaminase (isomerizing) [Dasania]MCR8921964.1 glutamine--fructose-6-phosphate transaminase (isomerizing) [Dasania sp. GY-MA-18]MCZ0864392.1 glutamine--fructose-6-phosphate transaminase (isomerizing) [Dasania phycosphaerae]MCZ0868120.1 glutamine--fructose-6-phosphate transaminase (isomerizing) [Dasania phycosphaerae]
MCGIVGAAARREVAAILVEGLKRLEYRGYDSAGVAIINHQGEIGCHKRLGKVAVLDQAVTEQPLAGSLGIAHTRWATHGKPSEENAHPHLSNNEIALVHNGIIENHEQLREQLTAQGYVFVSQTDTETIVHLIHSIMKKGEDLFSAVKLAVEQLEGAFGLAVIHKNEPERIVCARSGSPLVLGLGIGENFLASDQLALRQVTDRFIYLEEGDFAVLSPDSYDIYDAQGEPVKRKLVQLTDKTKSADKGQYRHYMLKEIYEQPEVIKDTLRGRISKDKILEQAFGAQAKEIFDKTKAVQIIACGTSYHSGMVAKYLIEGIAGVPCRVEVASEFRYRKFVVQDDTLIVTISQSGETADTLAALRLAKTLGYAATMTICNVAQSSLVRESDLALMTEAGPEVGVASTKAFTTQLVALVLLTIALGKRNGLSAEKEAEMVSSLHQLPQILSEVLTLDQSIEKMSEAFADKHNALFLGRGVQWPVAMEGALKLKEISYIHAESYPAGELKHGPLALVDSEMPIVAVAPNDELLEKLKSNLEEVQARGGELFVFADNNSGFSSGDGITVIKLAPVPELIAPIVYTIPLQLLSYHVAVLKGTDVDQPRNLAKSVTVE